MLFITLEGIDGSGKTTQAKLLSDWLKEKYPNKEILLTYEPGGWDNGSILREMVTCGALQHPWSEAYLFMLDRCEHIAKIIQPALDKNTIVICERYHDSTLAYQVWGRGLPLKVLNSLAVESNFPVPDITLFFDLNPDISEQRVSNRGQLDAFESEGEEFMKSVREGYVSLSKSDFSRWITIDASLGNSDAIFKKVIYSLNQRGYFID